MNHATPDIFICHSADTVDIARALRGALGADVSAFLPADDLQAGDPWDEVVPARIAEAPVVVVIVSPAWLKDHYTRDATLHAIDRRTDDAARRVVPLYALGTDPSEAYGLRRLHGYDLRAFDITRIAAKLRVVLPRGDDDEAAGVVATPLRPAMVLVPAGSFIMGSPGDEFGRQPDEGPAHGVDLPRSFYLARNPVTCAQYAAIQRNATPALPNHPAVGVNWLDAVEYCNRLSHAEGLEPAYHGSKADFALVEQASGYRLPTEAEWEYACRAGSTAPFSNGARPSALIEIARFRDNASRSLPEVATTRPNAFGLYDMHGLVWEWCGDWHSAYQAEACVNPCGPATGRKRVLRGGSFRTDALACRSAARLGWRPAERGDDIGFRIARPVPP